MNDIVVVRVFECVADLRGDGNDAREIRGSCLREAWSLDQFHHEKRKAARLADIVNRDDVWMIQCGGCTRLAHETFAAVRCLTGCRQDLDCDFATELEISCAKDCAHAAATELAVEPVAFAQDCAGSGGSR